MDAQPDLSLCWRTGHLLVLSCCSSFFFFFFFFLSEGDGDVSNEPSPSLFEDDGVRLNTSAVKSTGRKCVFISDSESSGGNTPQLPGKKL